jgi:hypothetical protein
VHLPPSIISHISIGTNDYPRQGVLRRGAGHVQIGQEMRHGEYAAYGRALPEFWVGGCNGMSNSGKCFSPNTHGREQLR